MLFLIACTKVNAQFGDADVKAIHKLKNCTTLVLMMGDSTYDNWVEMSFEASWKFNPYKMISSDALNKYIGNENYAVFTLGKTTVSGQYSYREQYYYAYVPIREKDKELEVGNAQAYGYLQSGDFNDFVTRVPMIINAVSDYLTILNGYEKGKISNTTIADDVYKPKTLALEKKTLLISKKDVDEKYLNAGTMDADYTFKTKAVNEEVILDAILERDESVAILHAGQDPYTGRAKWFVYDCATFEVISFVMYENEQIKDTFFDKLNKLIKKQQKEAAK